MIKYLQPDAVDCHSARAKLLQDAAGCLYNVQNYGSSHSIQYALRKLKACIACHSKLCDSHQYTCCKMLLCFSACLQNQLTSCS